MSLQGSFQTIALPDVMTLLASSSKTGELRVVGGHVEGRLWLQEGQLVQSGVGKARGHVDAMFELLRLSDGNFVFRDGVEATEPQAKTPVEPVVRQAQERLQEWHEIEAVVPSLEHRIRLVPELPSPEVTLTADDWQLVIAVALAGTVRGVVEELGVDYFDGCRGVKRLVDANLVLVEAPRVRGGASDSGRGGRRGAAATDGVAPGESEPVAARDDKGFPPLESLVTSVSVTPSRSSAFESILTSGSVLGDEMSSGDSSLSTASSLLGAGDGQDTASGEAPRRRRVAADWRLPKDAEPVRIMRHDEPEEDGTALAVVRHLFLNAEDNEPQPGLDWQSWNGGTVGSPGSAETAPVPQASIRAIRPLSSGSPGDGVSPLASLLAAAPAPAGPPAPAAPVAAAPVAAGPPAPAAPVAAAPAVPLASPAVGVRTSPADLPAPAPAPPPAAAGVKSAPMGPVAAPAGLAAVPAAAPAERGRGQEKDPESINRGLLLKFLSSVKP